VVEQAAAVLARRGDLAGVRILVTAGGTREPIDLVRYIGNRSSGRMGHAVAAAAARRGAAVTLVTTTTPDPEPAVTIVQVATAEEMAATVFDHFDAVDVVVMAAAVADFRPKAPANRKLKKTEGPPEIVLEPTPDILGQLGARRAGQFLVGFAAESDDVGANAAQKLRAKGVDLMVGNDVRSPDSGFEVDTNRAVLLDAHGGTEELGLLTKVQLADLILDRVLDAQVPPEPRFADDEGALA
jgi:phosphopantothenoylcysteine decarboxylase/phosphopantothenate--cysteine ligase